MRRAFGIILLTAVASSSFGCNKLKSALGHGDDGGTESAGAGKGLSQLLDGFEGEIGFRAAGKGMGTSGGAPLDVTLDIKNSKIRADIPPGLTGAAAMQGYVVIRSDEKKVYFVQDTQKQAIVIDLNQAGEQLSKMKQGGGLGLNPSHPAPTHAPPKVTKTGKMDTVVGQKCENWDIENTETQERVQLCVAQQGVSWFHIPITGVPTEMAWANELIDGNHFPLRAIMFGKTGAEEGRIEVTRMDKKPLADSLFEVPAGYNQVDLAQLMQGFGGLGAAGLGAAGAGGAGGPGEKLLPLKPPHAHTHKR